MSTPPLPEGWAVRTAPDGRVYYANTINFTTQWVPPTMPAASAAAAASKTPHSTTSAAPTTSTVIQVPKTKPAASGDARYTLSSLVSATGQRDLGQGLFELERDKLLEINLTDGNQLAWIKKGTMVARRGNVKFSRQSTKEQGWKTVMTKVFSGDGITLVKCEGKGKVFVADTGKMVSIVQLRGESLSVNGNDVLAMSSGLRYNIKSMPGAGVMSAGLFNCRIAGSGLLAFTCHGSVVTLSASPSDPVYTDPNAAVAWTHDPTMTVDYSLRSVFGRTTGEEFQLCFTH